ASVVRDRRRRFRRPATFFLSQDRLSTDCRRRGRPFAAGMRELHAKFRDTILAAEIMHALERGLIFIRPHAAHFGEMRPCALTLVISQITSPAQPSDMLPRCIRCQSLAEPLLELYWHIGETTIRFGRVKPRMVIGENRTLAIGRNSFQCGKFKYRHGRRAWRSPNSRSPKKCNIRFRLSPRSSFW